MRTRRSQSSSDPMPSGDGHRTVLLHEAIENLAIAEGDTIVDATLGGGGHMAAMLGKIGTKGRLVGFDLDADAIARAETIVGTDKRVTLIRSNFRNLKIELEKCGVTSIDRALFDLGWSGYQLSSGRGFSFLSDEPLEMTYDADQALTARTVVNEWGEQTLVDILTGWGEERYAKRIARAIVEARERKPIETGRELAEIIKRAVPPVYRFRRIHPATKTFQAIRIAVNDEMGALAEGMLSAWEMLHAGGRIAIISFHSIEDRLVKRQFAEWVKSGKARAVSKKPISPGDEELVANPRARSAKLRVVEKI